MCCLEPGHTPFAATFRYFGSLPELLKRRYREGPIVYRFREHPGVKDAIETMGIPHTEVDAILVNGHSINFNYQLQHHDSVDVYPVSAQLPEVSIILLSPIPPDPATFILDVHLGKLARRLRLLGFDCTYRTDFTDAEIMQLSLAEGRIILTCDRGILKHRQIRNGYLVRSDQVDQQVREILARYLLFDQIRAWRRCMACNGLLEGVAKAAIEDRLEPKTRLYYEDFHRCLNCDRLYWQGSHFEKLNRWLANLGIVTELETSLYQRIYTLIQQIPPGYVSSYGQIGQRVGCTARTVGFALAALPVGNDVPWQRVINSQGQVSRRADGDGNVLQRDLLENEGVCFDEKQRVDLSVYGWTFL